MKVSAFNKKRVGFDLPVWMVKSLEDEARKRGVTLQSLVKVWVGDKLGQTKKAG